ncbi:hypothetical protein [Campylobacter lanienae]|uniref:hypothetical protein n=1 Tax=Campylobacter lanienae TaxID=75658 RepID=UPI000BB40F17|nr:hypothetical protein [Campylobacter lanienae]
MMPHQVRTNTKLAIILNRYRGDEFTAMWKAKAKVVSKHTQRMRIMWERLSEGDATLPLFDNDYEPKSIAELFTPELPQSIETEQPKEQTKNRHNRGTPLAGTLVFGSLGATCCPAKRTSKNKSPSLEELKELFWAEELRNPPRQRRKQ